MLPVRILPQRSGPELEKLLELTGALQLGAAILCCHDVTQMINALRSAHTNVPKKALDILPEVVNGVVAEHIESLKEAILHIYDEHLTLEDVRGLNQFYSTELGRKVVKTFFLGYCRKASLLGRSGGKHWARRSLSGCRRAFRERAFRSDGAA